MNEQLRHEPISRPGEPTSAPPGSPTKIEVLTERAARREALFHPGDNLKRVLPIREREEEELGPLDQILPDAEIDDEEEEEEDLEAELAG
jgi:hypothetical protein